MKKTLYSLMLSDDVVQAVDALAHRLGMSRSAMINQILADHVSVPTPEQRIHAIFQGIESLVSQELVPFVTPNSASMALKSSLTYKYRPTITYEVDLSGARDTLGTLSVNFRTRSDALIASMRAFFQLWIQIEEIWLIPLLGGTLEYVLCDGRFLRPLASPESRNCTAEDLAEAISNYIQLFDRLLKGYLNGQLDGKDVENAYRQDCDRRTLLL